jgi:hypothetical protein
MKLEDILAEWDKDSQLDRTKLDIVALGLPQMHAKYIRLLSHERLLLRKYEAEYKTLKLDKHLFYVDGPDEEQVAKGWKLPPKGRIVKSDVGPWLEADKDLITLSLKIGMQQEKIEILKSIVDVISRLGFQVKNAIDWMRFQNGS